jgi:hypothetical protein
MKVVPATALPPNSIFYLPGEPGYSSASSHYGTAVRREDVPMPLSNATSATDKYRVKAYELLSLAERAGDPEQRADLLRFARMWMSLTEPIDDLSLRKLPHEI